MRSQTRRRRGTRALGAMVAALLAAGTFIAPAQAVELLGGDVRLSWDTTVSWGALFRVDDPDPNLIGLVNGGEAFSANADDGNLNYDKGMASNVFQLTSEIEFSYYNRFGIFVRGRSFYDLENEDGDRERTPLSEPALDRVGYRSELLDAFTWFRFDLGPMPVELRVGDQVLSWGESTFIPGGINTINPVDVSALRTPGSELRDALLPDGIASFSIGFTPDLSFEAFYQYDWDRVRIDPPGSFFSTADFVGDGAEKVLLAFGEVSDLGTTLPISISCNPPRGTLFPNGAVFCPDFLSVLRAPDREPEDGGQYGGALRLFAPWIGDTEFGLYYINYHSRLPVLSGVTGTGQARRTANQAFFFLRQVGVPVRDAAAIATDVYSNTARYFAVYPEDIKLYGLSFNTQIGKTALQGEISYRKDLPVQIDDVELILSALSPLADPNVPFPFGFQTAFADNQLGAALFGKDPNVSRFLLVDPDPGTEGEEGEIPGYVFAVNSEIQGFMRTDFTQVQATATRILGPILGANTSVIVGEAAWSKLGDYPDPNELRLEAPGTFTSGNPRQSSGPSAQLFRIGGAHAGKQAEPLDAFADETAWGYRIAGRLEYLNAIGPINLLPRFSWLHDVDGNSPGPGGNFIEGRTALTVGVSGTYLQAWEADLSYTSFSGAGRYNLLNDRDFVSVNLKYSF